MPRGPLLVAAVLLIAGCAFHPMDRLKVEPDTPHGQIGSIRALDIVVVFDPAKDAAQLTGSIANTDPTIADEISGVSVNGTMVAMSNPIPLPPGAVVNLAAPGGPRFVLTGVTGLTPGLDTEVDLTFQINGRLSMPALVALATGPYAGYPNLSR